MKFKVKVKNNLECIKIIKFIVMLPFDHFSFKDNGKKQNS